MNLRAALIVLGCSFPSAVRAAPARPFFVTASPEI
jgi:hypothetical protein